MPFTPSQVAEMLDISPPTLRRWSKRFASSLSEGARPGQGRHRNYTHEDVEIMRRAKELLALGLTYEKVADILTVQPQREEVLSLSVPEEGAGSLTQLQSGWVRAFQAIAQRDAELSQALETIADQRQEIQELKRGLEDLERKLEDRGGMRELERVRLRLDILEKWQGRSWLARLFGWW